MPKIAALFASALLFVLSPAADAANAIPSCYAAVKSGMSASPPTREIFLLVDQTTPIDETIRSSVLDAVGRLAAPGSSFTVAKFSEFAPGHAAAITAAGTIEQSVPAAQRDSIGVRLLHNLDQCLAAQAVYGKRIAVESAQAALASSHGSFAHSDVMASLRQLSATVSASPARERIVILVSDMLEHSSATSFYERKMLRTIDPRSELSIARNQHLTGDFRGARIFVIGAGAIAPDQAGTYRSAAAIDALQSFWNAWFHLSNARLAGFGEPNLMTPIQ